MSEATSLRPLGAPGDLGWVIEAHGEIYASEFGWDTSFEALVAEIVTRYASTCDPKSEAAWIAEFDGRRAGCVFLVRKDEVTAQLRILLVHPTARGHGIGALLVETCIAFARQAGYARLVLWTNDPLAAAARIYRAAGFVLTDEKPHHSFGKDLIGQTYEVDLVASGHRQASL